MTPAITVTAESLNWNELEPVGEEFHPANYQIKTAVLEVPLEPIYTLGETTNDIEYPIQQAHSPNYSVFRFVTYVNALLLSALSSLITDYWVIGVIFFLPLVLRYSSHYTTDYLVQKKNAH